MKKLYVMSLGGSLLVPELVDGGFALKFKKLVLAQVKKGRRFIIVAGGGQLCRQYQSALLASTRATQDDLDWLGIYSTRLNAQLLRLAFGKLAYPDIVENPNKRLNFNQPILVSGGWIPGRSTDDTAVRLARTYGATEVINISNVDYVYDKDPRTNKDAKRILQMSWQEYRKMIGSRRTPGMHVPFDPVAAKLAQERGNKVYFVGGKSLANLDKIFSGKKFQGTIIE